MAVQTTQTKTAVFEFSLENNEDSSDTVKRSISFDLPANSTVEAENLETIASSYFTVAGMSNVFQPTSWRDYEGNDSVYILKGVTPSIVEKTVSVGDFIQGV